MSFSSSRDHQDFQVWLDLQGHQDRRYLLSSALAELRETQERSRQNSAPITLPNAPILPVQHYQAVLLASTTSAHAQYPENLSSHNDNALSER